MALTLNEVQTKIRQFEEKEFEHSCNGVDLVTEEFTDILKTDSLRSLKLATNKKNRKRHSSQKWFDNECYISKRKLNRISNDKHRNPFDMNLRQQYHSVKKQFKKLTKSKKFIHMQSKIDNLIENKNSHQFWKNL